MSWAVMPGSCGSSSTPVHESLDRPTARAIMTGRLQIPMAAVCTASPSSASDCCIGTMLHHCHWRDPSLAGARLSVCYRLLRMGIQPRLKKDAGSEKFPYVLFSAPPSGSNDYPGEVNIQSCVVLSAACSRNSLGLLAPAATREHAILDCSAGSKSSGPLGWQWRFCVHL